MPKKWLYDIALAVLVVVVALATLLLDLGDGESDLTALSAVLILGTGAALVVRRRWPVAVLWVVVALRLVLTWNTTNEVTLVLGAAIALYTVARSGARRSSLIISGVAAALMMVGIASLDDDSFVPEFLGEGAQLVLPIALADAARSRSDRVADLIEREASLRVHAERLNIARDLHDVVAHGLATISVQSGVAAHLLDRDPDHAREALEIINETGRSSLEELRMMVGVLRSSDDHPLSPTPSDPNDLTRLLDGASNAGIELTSEINGRFPDDVSDLCVIATHRIVQEALTNVATHAGGASASVSIEHEKDGVAVCVTNEAGTRRTGATPSTGVGVLGMSERAASIGGELRAGTTDSGGFQVTATLPYSPQSARGSDAG